MIGLVLGHVHKKIIGTIMIHLVHGPECFLQQFLDMLVPLFIQVDGPLLFIQLIIGRNEFRDHGVDQWL